MSLFGMMYKGLSGMNASQVALDVVGQNIANMKNPDYSKQTVNTVTNIPIYTTYGSIGTGVTVESITRSYDEILQRTIRNEASAYTMFGTMSSNLEAAMLYFNELEQGSGLGDALKDYFDAWSNLANSATDDTDEALIKRQQLLEAAETLTYKIREGHSAIQDTITQIDESITNDVNEINEILKTVAQLNEDIAKAESGGNPANDLRDLRDAQLDKLSEKANITVSNEANGQVTVLVGSQLAVDAGSYQQLETRPNAEKGGQLDVYWQAGTFLSEPINITDTISGGSIAGAIKSREQISEYLVQLDELATTMIIETNKVHSSGQGLERFSSVTGTQGVENPTYSLNSEYGNLGGSLDAGSFRITIYNDDGEVAAVHDIQIDPDVDNMLSIEQKINQSLGIEGSGGFNNNQPARLSADLGTSNELIITVSAGYTIAFGEDTTGFLAYSGINGFFSGSSATDIDVTQLIKDDPQYIATGITGAPGDNTNAKLISNIQFENIESIDNASIGEFYGVFIGQLGIDKAQIDTYAATKMMTFENLYNQQQSIRGVSEQEELLDLSLYQRIFEANSRFVTIVDELLNTVVNGLGA